MGQSTSTSRTSTSIFSSIPPERVGLDGEYDHHGLAKRVSLAFSQHFPPSELSNLRVSQRGAVVVLMGNILSQGLLVRLVNIAMSVNGAADVEINGVSVAEPLRLFLQVKPSRMALHNLLSLVNQT